MAQTLNGFVADIKGSESFLADENYYTFKKLAEKTGCFIIGRKTYDAVNKWTDFSLNDVKAKLIVVSSKKHTNKKEVFFVKSPKEAVKLAKKFGNKVLLVGGGKNNTSFMEQGLVDEIIVNIEPVIIGDGIKIFSEGKFLKKLKFIGKKQLSHGIVQLHYKVE